MPTNKKQAARPSFSERVYAFIRSVWFFPAILLVLLVILTAFRISGSSVGMYYTFLNGDKKDPSLLLGEPRAIRSDEWGVVTPAILSQAKEGFPTINKTIGDGQDMAVTLDVPIKEWSTIFRPQNWSFFVMPVEYAFAFKWWLMGILLLLGCYTFALTLLPGRYLLASLLSISVFFSPFVQWWYQPITTLSLAYGLFATSLAVYLLRDIKNRKHQLALAVAFTYVLCCMGLVLYVPFLVPIGFVLAAFVVGHFINLLSASLRKKQLFKRLVWLAIPAVIAGGVLLAFMHTHSSVVETISNSVYPGHRTEPSGGMKGTQLFGGYYAIQLQDTEKAAALDLNQSEASNFVLLFPFLVPFFAYLFIRRKQLGLAIDWRVIGLLTLATVFAIRCFVPASEFIFDILQLNRIPHNRLLIGFGLLNIFLLVIAIQSLIALPKQVPFKLRLGSTLFIFVTALAVGISLKMSYIGYLESAFKIFTISIFLAGILWFLLKKRFILALGLLAVFSLASGAMVNPLYQGFGALTNSKLADTVRGIGDSKGEWVVGDYAANFETLPSAVGVKSISGVYSYPQLAVWDDIAKDKASEDVYNRYAHVFFSVEPLTKPAQGQGAYFDPPALDAFRVHVDPCGEFLKDQNVRYVLQTTKLTGSCVKEVTAIPYPEITFRIYELTR